MRIVSFCFDDGFLETAGKAWALFAARRLAATYCVLAAPELARDPYIASSRVADWGFWREAAAAGHEVAPHGWAHEHLGQIPPEAALSSIDRALDAFRLELPGFSPAEAVFHLAYLTAPAEVLTALSARVLAVRRGMGGAGLNPTGPRAPGEGVDCITFGDPAEAQLAARVERFLAREHGWLVLVLHGLDGEGWGPVSSAGLERIVDRLLEAGVRIAPAGTVARELLA